MSDILSTKPFSEYDQQQVIKKAGSNDGSLQVNGFVNGKVGHRITRTQVQPNPAIDDYRFLDVVQTINGNTSNALPTVTGIVTTTNLKVGQYVIGSGIPANTTILSIDSSSQITLSQNATATATVSLKYANLLQRLRIEYDDAARTNVDAVERLD